MTEMDMIVEAIDERISAARGRMMFWVNNPELNQYFEGEVDGLLEAKRFVREAQFEIMKNSSCFSSQLSL